MAKDARLVRRGDRRDRGGRAHRAGHAHVQLRHAQRAQGLVRPDHPDRPHLLLRPAARRLADRADPGRQASGRPERARRVRLHAGRRARGPEPARPAHRHLRPLPRGGPRTRSIPSRSSTRSSATSATPARSPRPSAKPARLPPRSPAHRPWSPERAYRPHRRGLSRPGRAVGAARTGPSRIAASRPAGSADRRAARGPGRSRAPGPGLAARNRAHERRPARGRSGGR